MTCSTSDRPASADPATYPSIAPRTPNPRPGVSPNVNASGDKSQDAIVLPVRIALSAATSSLRPPERGFGAVIGSPSGLPASRETDLPQETEVSITPPVDEDVRNSSRIEDDLLSPDPVDDQSLHDNLNAVKVQLQDLSRMISECPLSQDAGTRLHQIHQDAKELSEYKDQETRIVGFIGETGAGWCLLLLLVPVWTV